jgi:hypothetical protein
LSNDESVWSLLPVVGRIIISQFTVDRLSDG